MGGSDGGTSADTYNRPRTRAAKPRQERRAEPSSHLPPTCNRIGEDQDMHDTIRGKELHSSQVVEPRAMGRKFELGPVRPLGARGQNLGGLLPQVLLPTNPHHQV